MGRRTGNTVVVKQLQNALTAFLDDHRKAAENDPEWVEGTTEMTDEERMNEAGCGCDDCIFAGTLRGRIY